MSGRGFQHVRSSTSLIAPDRIVKIDLVGQSVNSVAVDGSKNVSDALSRIGRKLKDVDLSLYGIFEYEGTTAVRELSVMDVLADVKARWPPAKASQMRFVFNKSGQADSDKWKDKLSEQQKKMNRISKRMSARRSKRPGESYADKLKLFEIEQLEKRMTQMQTEMERNAQMKQQEQQEEQKRKKEEREVRRKTMVLENKFAELEARAGQSGGPRVDHEKAMETERKLKEIEDRLAARNRAKEKEMEAKQESMLAAMEKRMRELEEELENEDDDMSEAEMQKQIEQRQREERAWEDQLNKQREERERERERKKKEREMQLDHQKKELESKLKLLEEALVKKQQKRDDALMQQKQQEVSRMEARMKDLEAALSEGDAETEAALEEQRKALSIAERDAELSAKERLLKEKEERLAKLEAQSSQMEDIMAKMAKFDQLEGMIEKIRSGAIAVGGGAGADMRSGEELKKKIEECQKILMSGTASDQEIEAANIELEKALDAYEKTSEFQQEQAKARQEKEEREAPKNKAALQKMKGTYTLNALKTDKALLDKVRKYPELRLIMMDSDSILKKHENDFKMFVLNGLTLDELRAIRGACPKFRTDQRVQVSFLDNLDQKIDDMEANASKPKPVKRPAKKLNFKKSNAPASPGGLFAELVAKRGGGQGGLKKSTGPQKKSMASAASSGLDPSKMPPLPPPGPDPNNMPPLPPPGPDPGAGGGAPAPAAPVTPSRPPANAGAEVEKLKGAADALRDAMMGADEKAVAGRTRECVTQLKSVSALCKSWKPEECTKLDGMASVIVVGVKKCLAAKKAGDDQFIAAQSSLAQVLERLKNFAQAVV